MARAAARPVPEVLAAVDLGSNSFHLVVARYVHGQLTVVDRLREVVRLGAGVDDAGRLDREVAARALACLERFGQRLRDMHARDVRVVGTNALRKARRKQAFLERARDALGHPIEIVSGMEEARLIYAGVAHTSPRDGGRRLVCDIGGGSTELIIGDALEPLELASLQVGCVNLSARHFPGGRLSAKRMARARLAVQLELEPVRARFRRLGWQQVSGSAGSIRAVGECLRELDPAATAVTAEGLEELLAEMARVDDLRDLEFDAIDDERRDVFAGGVAILAEIFDTLALDEMRVADGALREGLLYDMIGRMTNEDARDRTVRAMQRRYQVDDAQAARVEATAVGFLAQVEEAWQLADPLAAAALRWGARLHEIGLDVSHNGYQRHGAYLLENADMYGFPREEQLLLARLVGAHRRKPSLDGVDKLVPPWDRRAQWLIVLLRLAVLLHRGRSDAPLPAIQLEAGGRTLTVRFPARWLRDHALTVADLQREIGYLRGIGVRLRVFSARTQLAASAPAA
ncbi:MAG: exopolyphosphatase [Steroidobacteraceae bacterium]|nr:exopolyphosphatase [Steroidobacteraceae bacterium]